MRASFPDILNLIFAGTSFRELPSTHEIHETKSTAKHKTYTVLLCKLYVCNISPQNLIREFTVLYGLQ